MQEAWTVEKDWLGDGLGKAETAWRMSGQERPVISCLASLSPGKALSLDSLPHDTQSRGAMSCSVLRGKSCHARPAHARPSIATRWAAAAAAAAAAAVVAP
eukprot:1158959-Pelagomonas_calceolata.AAC.2